MKILKYFFGLNIIGALFFLSFTTHLTSCIKEIVHDTLLVKDTITVRDTVCHVNVGMVAHYTFDNGSLLDQSGNNNNITFSNAVATADRFGKNNNAFLFDGNSAYMKVPNSSSLNPTTAISIVAIVKVNDFYRGTCHENQIIGKGYPDEVKGLYLMRITDPFGHCYEEADTTKEFFWGAYGDNIPEGSASGVISDTNYIQTGKWYTVVYTYDGHESRIYVNGNLEKIEQKKVPFTPTDTDLYIGRNYYPDYPYWFNGVIDEIRIYNRALCECEVDQITDYSLNDK